MVTGISIVGVIAVVLWFVWHSVKVKNKKFEDDNRIDF